MEIKAQVKHDQKTLKEYVRFNFIKTKNYKTLYKLYSLSHLITMLFFIGALIYTWINYRESQLFTIAIILNIGGPFIWILNTVAREKYLSNKYKKVFGEKASYDFHEKSFVVLSTNFERSNSITKEYSELYMVYETKNYFYLYLNRTDAYIVDKSMFEKGKELREIISKHLTSNEYIIYN